MLQGMLSDGRSLLMAVAPAASISVKSAAVVSMADGLAAALFPSGEVDKMLDDEHLLPWRASHSMAYMVRTSIVEIACVDARASVRSGCHQQTVVHLLQQAALDAVCGATSAADLLGSGALPRAWQAAALALQWCCEVM